jgi:hypothetical protein
MTPVPNEQVLAAEFRVTHALGVFLERTRLQFGSSPPTSVSGASISVSGASIDRKPDTGSSIFPIFEPILLAQHPAVLTGLAVGM